nr:MAG TPA: hypothetical protein [Caudoviricetes sp.]
MIHRIVSKKITSDLLFSYFIHLVLKIKLKMGYVLRVNLKKQKWK